MRKTILSLVLIAILLGINPAFAAKKLVEITPLQKITTAGDRFLEGDYVDFKVVGTDKIVRGLIVKYDENGFGGKAATLVIDQFHAVNCSDKFEGTITLYGNEHWQFLEYFLSSWLVRGGEVTVLPNRDVFELWREE